MTPITVTCDGCAGTGDATHEDRHTSTNMDLCRKCGGEGKIPARTGETPEASFQPPPEAVAPVDLGQVAYEERWQGFTHSPAWAELTEEGKQVWRRVALAARNAPWPPATLGRIVLQVDQGVEGLWYVTSPAPAGLLVAGETMRGALDQVEKALEDMKRATAEVGGDAILVDEAVAKEALGVAKTLEAARPVQPLEGDALLEALAGFLHDEVHTDNESGWTWPLHAEDDGYRGNAAFVTITPPDVQARRREEAGRILRFLEPRASTEARSLEAACEPWRFGLGGPSDRGSPLANVFDAGVTYAIRELALLTKSVGWSRQDGSEDHRNDVIATLLDVLKHAGLHDPDTGRLATLTSVNDQGRTHVEEALTAQIRALEASQRMDGLTAAEWQQLWTEQGNTLAGRIGELQTENDRLRATLGNGNALCIYCSLPREKWAECASGFPGYGRADDAALCPHVGAELASQEKIKEQDVHIGSLEEQIRKDAYAAFNARADFEVELDALRLLLRRNEVRVGRQRELLQENNKLLDRARAAEASNAKLQAALQHLFPFVDRAVGEGIVLHADGVAPAMDPLDAYTAAGRALGFEAVDDPTLMALSAPGDTPEAAATVVPVLYLNYRGHIEVRFIVPIRFWEGESEWHPGERHFLRVIEPSTKKVRDFAISGILAWGQAAIDQLESNDRAFQRLRDDLAAERDAKVCGEIEVRHRGLDPVSPDSLHIRLSVSQQMLISGGPKILEPLLERAKAELTAVLKARPAVG